VAEARRAWARAGAVAAAVLAVDQATKALVRGSLAFGEEDPVVPLLTLVHVRNRGVAFGALSDAGTVVGVVVAVALVALVAFFATQLHRPWAWAPVGLLAGGAVGNIVDRLRQGWVTDFLKLPAWPAFNVADVAITVGVVVLVIVTWREDRAPAGERA
jgi:signal peptidase II